MRLQVDSLLRNFAQSAGLGTDELRFKGPVRPGDTLTARATVTEVRTSKSQPDKGLIGLQLELHNQHEQLVWYATSWTLIQRRPE